MNDHRDNIVGMDEWDLVSYQLKIQARCSRNARNIAKLKTFHHVGSSATK